MENAIMMLSTPVAELREKVDSQTRFKKVTFGFDPRAVNEYIRTQNDAIERLQQELSQARREYSEQLLALQSELKHQEHLSTQIKISLDEMTLQANEHAARAEAAEERECAGIAECERYQEIINEMKTASDSKNADKLHDQLTQQERECSELTAQLIVAQNEAQIATDKLEGLVAENSALSKQLDEERTKRLIASRDATVHAASIKALNRTNVARIVDRMNDIAQLLSHYSRSSEEVMDKLISCSESD